MYLLDIAVSRRNNFNHIQFYFKKGLLLQEDLCNLVATLSIFHRILIFTIQFC